ncbi:glycosyltransferase family 4 protein [Caulobacter radicis]|uniref:Glycosyl transferase n=1 Tax=Caulobacter radicis TaxID=2172650 RepID=A0A2T9JD93_9CAUL|nr:glycosyltransferase family 4 protein [Caulobacter radicis]PVM80893.1 glycosyl transferase [Caulobacter radicis]
MSILPDEFTLLQVTPELETGGAEQTTIDVAHGVVAQGGKALVATRGGRMAARLEADGGRLAQMPAQSKNPLIMLGNAARLIDLIRREKVTLVHARSRAPAFSALWAAHATRTPFVATYHGVYNAKSSLKRWYNAVMTKGDLVIANSEYTRAHVIAEHGIHPDKVVAIPRGVDLTRFEPGFVSADRVEALRKAWGVAPDERRLKVLLAGRLTRWKGQGLAIEAVARLKALSDTRVLLLLAGDDQGRKGYRAELEHMIAQAGLQDSVKLVGHCDDMPAAYLLADLAIAPSLEPEAFGRTAVEPQVMGRPVIAADHGATRETVVPGETGWLAAPGDAEAWAQALNDACEAGAAGRQAMGMAARARARRLYSVDAMVEATLKVYARVMAARKTGAGVLESKG